MILTLDIDINDLIFPLCRLVTEVPLIIFAIQSKIAKQNLFEIELTFYDISRLMNKQGQKMSIRT